MTSPSALLRQFYVGAAMAFAVAGCSHVVGSSPLPNEQPSRAIPAEQGSDTRAISSTGHLYVLDSVLNEVFEFPIHNGTVSTKPDNVLRVTVPPSKDSEIANFEVDGTGSVYAMVDTINPGQETSYIFTYAPGARGNAVPIRTLTIPSFGNGFTIDSHANVYYFDDPDGIYAIYAAGASGSDSPIFTTTGLNAMDEGVVVGSTLYAAYAFTAYVYANAQTAPTLTKQFCRKYPRGVERLTHQIAVDPSGDRLFAATSLIQGAINVFPMGKSSCPVIAAQIKVGGPALIHPFWPIGVAYDPPNTIFASDVANDAVYQVTAQATMQSPMVTLSGLFKDPTTLAVGP
jgi:hypothetical protein